MAVTQLLPVRLRVALRAVRNDARHVVRAFRDPRFKGVRSKPETSRIEVRFVPERRVEPSSPEAGPEVGGVVVFAESGVTLELSPNETILEAGLRNGVDLLFSCTLGGCGACMLQVREGEVGYDDPAAICLTEEEIQDGNCLACVGRPQGRVVLEA